MLIYSTRTFSNSVELAMASVLLYLVAHTMKRTDETVYLQHLVQSSYKEAKTIKEKVEIQKKPKLIPPHDFKFILPIAAVCALARFLTLVGAELERLRQGRRDSLHLHFQLALLPVELAKTVLQHGHFFDHGAG